MPSRDPLSDPAGAVRRVYSYVAYRLGDGPDAEDVTSSVIERALRYRSSYDKRRGKPESWLLGIARTCVDDALRQRVSRADPLDDTIAEAEVESDALERLAVGGAVARLDERDRELIALRYGADLSTREIAAVLDMKPNAVDVALHRCRARLRGELEATGYGDGKLSPAQVVSAVTPQPTP